MSLFGCASRQNSHDETHDGDVDICQEGWLFISPSEASDDLESLNMTSVLCGRSKRWKRRWFRLTLLRVLSTTVPNRYDLRYYLRPNSRKAEGSVAINTITGLCTSSCPTDEMMSHLDLLKFTGDQNQLSFFCFEAEWNEIPGVRRRIHLLAEDAKAMLDWAKQLQRATGLQEARGQIESQELSGLNSVALSIRPVDPTVQYTARMNTDDGIYKTDRDIPFGLYGSATTNQENLDGIYGNATAMENQENLDGIYGNATGKENQENLDGIYGDATTVNKDSGMHDDEEYGDVLLNQSNQVDVHLEDEYGSVGPPQGFEDCGKAANDDPEHPDGMYSPLPPMTQPRPSLPIITPRQSPRASQRSNSSSAAAAAVEATSRKTEYENLEMIKQAMSGSQRAAGGEPIDEVYGNLL